MYQISSSFMSHSFEDLMKKWSHIHNYPTLHWLIVFPNIANMRNTMNLHNYYKKSKINLPFCGVGWLTLFYEIEVIIVVIIIISKLEQVQTCSHFRSESWSPTHFDRRSSLGAIAIGTAIHTVPFFLSDFYCRL